MKTVRFNRSVVVNDHRKGTRDEESYKEGESVKMTDSAATHWITRGAADEIDDNESQQTKKPGRPPKREVSPPSSD